MRHARNDYNGRIVDTEGKIPEDEPVFLLRATDMSTPDTIYFWADLNVKNGGDLDLSIKARKWASHIRIYQARHGCKPADL